VGTYHGCCERRCPPPCVTPRDALLFVAAECLALRRPHNHHHLSHLLSQHVTALIPERVAFTGAKRNADDEDCGLRQPYGGVWA
jgi:hypothetical protein